MTEAEKDKADELKARLDYCRTEDRHECTLIHYRMLWMLSCHTFLFAGYFVLSKETVDNHKTVIMILICGLAITITSLIWLAIRQAEQVIDKVHYLERQVFIDAKESKELEKYLSGYDLGRQWKNDQKDFHQILSFFCQRAIPIGFIVIWIVLLLISFGVKFTW